MKNRILLILLAVMLALSVGLISCGGEVMPEYSLTISSTEGGSVMSPGEPGQYAYDEGEVVSLVAKAEEGYEFVNWTGDVAEIADVEDDTTTITMNDDYSVTANFVKQYDLTIFSTAGGSVTMPGENAYTYDKGEVFNLVARAEGGYHFVSWTGDVGTVADVNAATTSIAMHGDYIISANFTIDLYFETDVWVNLYGRGTLPAEERNPTVFFQVFANTVMASVRVDLPDGGSVIVPPYTDLSSSDVDQITMCRFHIGVAGMPIAGGEYVFTGLDMAGEPIPEARNTDVWVGGGPPDPPTNVRAEAVEDRVLVNWDESAIIPGSFEPAAEPQLGFYDLGIHRIETGGMVYGVYGAAFISACSHLIPRDEADFVEGRDWGVSLGEMEDGTYSLDCWVQSIAPEGSLGKGCEYHCCDPSQTIIFTIQDGEITIK